MTNRARARDQTTSGRGGGNGRIGGGIIRGAQPCTGARRVEWRTITATAPANNITGSAAATRKKRTAATAARTITTGPPITSAPRTSGAGGGAPRRTAAPRRRRDGREEWRTSTWYPIDRGDRMELNGLQ